LTRDPRRRRRIRRLAAASLVVAVAYGSVALLALWRAAGTGVAPELDRFIGATTEILAVAVPDTPDDDRTVLLDVALIIPDGVDASAPAPAVVLLHGFASDRTSLAGRVQELVEQGYVVLAPSARGFGRSEGSIGLADPDREGNDLVALIDVLASRAEVERDGPDDPRVAVVGASYGGGLALIAASLDPRIDTVVAITAWHELGASLAPNAVGSASSGPLKVSWTSLLFTARTLGPGALGDAGVPGLLPTVPDLEDPSVVFERCGRFEPDICALADRAAIDGLLDPAGVSALARARIRPFAAMPPVLLIQGRQDTLFGADAAFANALTLEAGGAPVRVRLVAGGHGEVGAAATSGALAREIDAWLGHWLLTRRAAPEEDAAAEVASAARTGVLVHDVRGSLSTIDWPNARGSGTALRLRAVAPGALVDAASTAAGPSLVASLVAPAGGLPAALTVLPGVGSVADLVGLVGLGTVVDVPGQHLALTSAPRDEELLLLGAPTVNFSVASETGVAQLFVRLSAVAPGGRTRILGASVTPVRSEDVSRDPLRPTPLGITLPDLADLVRVGERLRLTIATTDQAFANVREPSMIWLDVTGLELVLRGQVLEGVPAAGIGGLDTGGAVFRAAPALVLPLVAIGAALAAGLVMALRQRRRPQLAPLAQRLELAASGPDPVVIRGLVKEYADGTRAVDGLDLTVRSGQVVGLLGPNGAGKTTTLRMLLGLITPTEGTVEVLGQAMRPGHPVLERVGALVEGPGLVPDLSGRDNLELFWRAGGRPIEDADLAWAISVADLGDAIDRPVRAYSHGMAQRLAIAQALLGRPELLVLDEPTDGLDPEQIRAMRRLLVRLGAEGHTVLVSSHLLSEVEQTCTHAVVVLRGRVVAAGPVSELGARGRTLLVEVDDRSSAMALLVARLGAERVTLEGSGLVVILEAPEESAEVIATLVSAGIAVRTATRRGQLEDAFLQLTGADPTAAEELS